MKKNFFFFLFIAVIFIMSACTKATLDKNYDAKLRIDSVKQDSGLFANQYIVYGKLRVFYTVLNNGSVLLNTYRYTINAMNRDSSLYQIAESHYHTVLPNSQVHDSTKIGIGNCRVAWTSMDNTLFQ